MNNEILLTFFLIFFVLLILYVNFIVKLTTLQIIKLSVFVMLSIVMYGIVFGFSVVLHYFLIGVGIFLIVQILIYLNVRKNDIKLNEQIIKKGDFKILFDFFRKNKKIK